MTIDSQKDDLATQEMMKMMNESDSSIDLADDLLSALDNLEEPETYEEISDETDADAPSTPATDALADELDSLGDLEDLDDPEALASEDNAASEDITNLDTNELDRAIDHDLEDMLDDLETLDDLGEPETLQEIEDSPAVEVAAEVQTVTETEEKTQVDSDIADVELDLPDAPETADSLLELDDDLTLDEDDNEQAVSYDELPDIADLYPKNETETNNSLDDVQIDQPLLNEADVDISDLIDGDLDDEFEDEEQDDSELEALNDDADDALTSDTEMPAESELSLDDDLDLNASALSDQDAETDAETEELTDLGAIEEMELPSELSADLDNTELAVEAEPEPAAEPELMPAVESSPTATAADAQPHQAIAHANQAISAMDQAIAIDAELNQIAESVLHNATEAKRIALAVAQKAQTNIEQTQATIEATLEATQRALAIAQKAGYEIDLNDIHAPEDDAEFQSLIETLHQKNNQLSHKNQQLKQEVDALDK